MQFRSLPPLHFLPAFEATGRLESVKAAATELRITPSAVSQQLRAIEEALGFALFERRARAVRLTAAGAEYLREVQQALASVAGAGRRLRARGPDRVLRISMADYLAYEFMLPRLSSFRARFPHVELGLDVSPRVVDFETCDMDAAIRIADGRWPGLVSHAIGDACVTPVCHPRMAAAIRKPADLPGQTLIELRAQSRRGWRAFMRKLGEREPDAILAFDGYLETLRAAEQGMGVTFGIFPLITEWVRSRRLAVPLALRVPFVDKICLVYRRADVRDPLYAELLAWLREEYRTLPALESGRLVRRQRTARGL